MRVKHFHCILQLVASYFHIRKEVMIRHDQLMKSRSKYIYFDVETTCSGMDTEGRARERLSTFSFDLCTHIVIYMYIYIMQSVDVR